jgi:hypothetical protein
MITITGKLTKVFEPQQKTDKFTVRKFWVTDKLTGSERFPNDWEFQLWNSDCTMIDNYQVGDILTFYVDIRGRLWTRQDGSQTVQTDIKCWNVEKEGKLYKPID